METLQNAPIKTISRKTYANINNSRKTGVSFFCSAFLRAIVCFQRIQNLILCIWNHVQIFKVNLAIFSTLKQKIVKKGLKYWKAFFVQR